MTVDIRATVTSSLGVVVSGNVSDDYVQGSGLIRCTGTLVVKGLIKPNIGTSVTISYSKAAGGGTIPRNLLVLSSFADPFRNTTTVELGCKFTYMADKKEAIDWTAFDDENTTMTPQDAQVVTVPITAQSVAEKCIAEIGITGTVSLTNKFSIERFDFSPGYVQVLSDLLVSESFCGYLNENGALQVFSLNVTQGTGPLLETNRIIDISKIGVGQLPGEAVVVSYTTLKLKKDVNTSNIAGAPWETLTTNVIYSIDVPYNKTFVGSTTLPGGITSTTTIVEAATATYNINEKTVTTNQYKNVTLNDGSRARQIISRETTLTTESATVAGALITDYLSNGINFFSQPITRKTYEKFSYDDDGNEVYYSRYVKGSLGFLSGALNVPYVFPGAGAGGSTDFLNVPWGYEVSLEAEERFTYIASSFQQENVVTYAPWFTTLQGQQAIARAFPSFTSSQEVTNFLNIISDVGGQWVGMGSLSQDGYSGAYGLPVVDNRVEITTKRSPQIAPGQADVNNAANANGGNANLGYRTESKSDLALALGSAEAQRRIEFSLPYAPDDTFIKNQNGSYTTVPSDAEQKAQLYGQVQNRILLGARNGMNIQTSPELLPQTPYSPFVVSAAGVGGAYLTNGTTWTFDGNGIVGSTDGLLLGGVGG